MTRPLRLRWYDLRKLDGVIDLVLASDGMPSAYVGKVVRKTARPNTYEALTIGGATKYSTNLRRAKAWLRDAVCAELASVAKGRAA